MISGRSAWLRRPRRRSQQIKPPRPPLEAPPAAEYSRCFTISSFCLHGAVCLYAGAEVVESWHDMASENICVASSRRGTAGICLRAEGDSASRPSVCVWEDEQVCRSQLLCEGTWRWGEFEYGSVLKKMSC